MRVFLVGNMFFGEIFLQLFFGGGNMFIGENVFIGKNMFFLW